MAELVDAADSKSVFERSGSSSLPRGTKIRKKPTLWSVFLCLGFGLFSKGHSASPVGAGLSRDWPGLETRLHGTDFDLDRGTSPLPQGMRDSSYFQISRIPCRLFPKHTPYPFKPLRCSGSGSSLGLSLPIQRPALTGRFEATDASIRFYGGCTWGAFGRAECLASSVCQPAYCRHPLV